MSRSGLDRDVDECRFRDRWYDVLLELEDDLREQPEALARRLAMPLCERPGLVVRSIRRAVEASVALTVLVITAPLMLYMVIAIRRDTPGPAFFRQTRLTVGGRPFELLKFRGMYVDARERFPELYDYELGQAEAAEYLFHVKDDPRVTPIGRRFRRSSLDELPNFWNVLRGEIGLVGPRPQIPEMFPYYGSYRDIVLSVKPGIFALPKVYFRDDLTLRDTYLIDAYYVHSRSLRLDAKVICRGIGTVLARRHVY